jgi:hypothetical protein
VGGNKEKAKDITLAQTERLESASVLFATTVQVQIFSKLPEDHSIYKLIGRVVSDWSYLEHRLDQIIWEFLGLSPALGACMTGQMMGHSPRYNTIIALIAHHKLGKTLRNYAYSQMGSVSNVSEERNRVVHDPWFTDTLERGTYRLKKMSRKDLTFGYHRYSDEKEILALLDKIKDRIDGVGRLEVKIRAARSPLLGKGR